MPVDTSMYGMIKPIDAMGAVEGGMRMRDLIDERNKKSAMQDAYKQGMKVGPDGKVNFDHNMTASALAQGGYGQEAYQAQQQGQSEQQKQMQMAVQNAQFGAQILGAAKNQQEWDKGLQELGGFGLDVSKLPGQYSPENQRFLVESAMTLGDRLAEQWKQKSYGLEQDKFDFTKKSTNRELDIKEKEAGAKKAGEAGKLATELRKERSGLDTTKATQSVSAAYNKVQSAAKKPSAAGDLSLIFNYMKMLDPGSVVRESEFRSAEQAKAWLSRAEAGGYRIPGAVRVGIQKLENGQFLLPEQRADFIEQAGGLYQSQMDIQKQVDAQYADIAEKSGVDPKDVLLDFQANKPPETKPPPLTKDQVEKMSREAKIAEAVRRGLLSVPKKQVIGAMSVPPGGGG